MGPQAQRRIRGRCDDGRRTMEHYVNRNQQCVLLYRRSSRWDGHLEHAKVDTEVASDSHTVSAEPEM